MIRDNTEEIARSITIEQGKTLADARGDVFRGLEVVESVCGMGNLLMGETLGNLARGVDTITLRQPLGVTAGICPFNFPAMIPLWMFPVANVCGNTMLLKPSEKDPGAAMIIAKLAKEAGLPDGVLQVILMKMIYFTRSDFFVISVRLSTVPKRLLTFCAMPHLFVPSLLWVVTTLVSTFSPVVLPRASVCKPTWAPRIMPL